MVLGSQHAASTLARPSGLTRMVHNHSTGGVMVTVFMTIKMAKMVNAVKTVVMVVMTGMVKEVMTVRMVRSPERGSRPRSSGRPKCTTLPYYQISTESTFTWPRARASNDDAALRRHIRRGKTISPVHAGPHPKKDETGSSTGNRATDVENHADRATSHGR